MDQPQIKVLIVDDSQIARDLLTFIIESDPLLKVIGIAEDGESAIEFIKKQTPDVIMMDVVMPKMNGYEVTQRIMQIKPIPIIVVSGSYNPHDVDSCYRAISAGALAIMEKPRGLGDPQHIALARAVVDAIKAMSGVQISTRLPRSSPLLSALQKDKGSEIPNRKGEGMFSSVTDIASVMSASLSPIDIVAIGAGIGGPQALQKILSDIPAAFPIPILIVQRISVGFISGLAEWLGKITNLKVSVATEGAKMLPGHVYIAPDQHQMHIVKAGTISLIKAASKLDICPSISMLFRSVGQVYGPRALGILLTGMGKDGVEELNYIKQKNGITLVQSEDGCVMFDSPKRAIEIGAARLILPVSKMASLLNEIVKKK